MVTMANSGDVQVPVKSGRPVKAASGPFVGIMTADWIAALLTSVIVAAAALNLLAKEGEHPREFGIVTFAFEQSLTLAVIAPRR